MITYGVVQQCYEHTLTRNGVHVDIYMKSCCLGQVKEVQDRITEAILLTHGKSLEMHNRKHNIMDIFHCLHKQEITNRKYIMNKLN